MPARELFLFTRDQVALIQRALRWQRKLRGPGVLRNDPDMGAVIGGGPPPAAPPGDDGRRRDVFVVTLRMVAGAANPVSWLYDCTDPRTGELLAEAASPLWRPFGNYEDDAVSSWAGHVPAPATRGIGYFTNPGAFVLLQAYEVYGLNTSCEDGEGSA